MSVEVVELGSGQKHSHVPQTFNFLQLSTIFEGIYKIVPQFQKVYPEIELQEFSGSMLSISPSTLEVPQLVNGYDHNSYLRL